MARPKIPEDLQRTKYTMVRLSEETQREFRAAALVLGKTGSAFLHDYILDLIDRAKTTNPAKFQRVLTSLTTSEPQPPEQPPKKPRRQRPR